LHLSKEWKFWEKGEFDHRITIIDKGNHRNSTLIQELSRCILGVIGMTRSEIFELVPSGNKVEKFIIFRKFCLDVYKKLKKNKLGNDVAKGIKNLFSNCFDYKFPTDWASPCNNSDLKRSLEAITYSKPEQTFNSSDKYYSTIHSAKGLEATCVLVCARTKNELNNWLDFENVIGKNDETRYGFVAFSRARKLLCIACLESLENKERKLLKELGIEQKLPMQTTLFLI